MEQCPICGGYFGVHRGWCTPEERVKPRNYERRSIPGVAPNLTVNRDGEVFLNDRLYHSSEISRRGIRKHDGTFMSIQMAIHLAFPDIPMREIPTQ